MTTDKPTPPEATPDEVVHATTPLQKITLTLFKIGLVSFLVSGIVLVLIQAWGLLVKDEALTIGTIPGLNSFMTISAAVTGVLGFIMSYLFHYAGGGED